MKLVCSCASRITNTTVAADVASRHAATAAADAATAAATTLTAATTTTTTTAAATAAAASTATTTSTHAVALTFALTLLLLLDALCKDLEQRSSISAPHLVHQALSFLRLFLLLCQDQSLLSLEPLAISFQACDAISAGAPSGCERSLNGLNAASRTNPSDKHRTSTRHVGGLRTRRTQALIRSIET
jgi:hypothetical protein